MNYRIVLQYDGSRYDGWQKQGNTANTIQGKLEQVLERMAGEPVEVSGAGRTDAGVHAMGQTANFHLHTALEDEEIKAYLNRYLPEDIEVVSIARVPDRFHSRLNAREKVYVYRIGTGGAKHVLERRQIWTVEDEPDVRAMKAAAAFLEGEHDFKSFCSNKRMKKSTVRRIRSIEVEQYPWEIRLIFTGNGFLYHMVRILTGTLLEAGRGAYPPEYVREILEGKNRELAGPCAPACGLCLKEVRY